MHKQVLKELHRYPIVVIYYGTLKQTLDAQSLGFSKMKKAMGDITWMILHRKFNPSSPLLANYSQ